MARITILLLLVTFWAIADAKPKLSPLSDEFIDLINSKQTSWKAGRNFKPDTTFAEIRNLLGVLPDNKLKRRAPVYIHDDDTEIPESFDARENWPECADIIGEIRDQANCGSCWAFGAVEAMSDRLCIHSNGTIKISVSAEDLLTCCSACGFGCNGGYLEPSWDFWGSRGLVSGGPYSSEIGCKTYSLPSCNHHVETDDLPACGDLESEGECKEVCREGYELSFEEDLSFGSSYSVPSNERQIQLEILKNGPVETAFDVYEDFVTYKSGVYEHVEGDYSGGHAVKILGWGVEDGKKYWLIANSWNPNWGDNGYFKFLRGVNHCFIEFQAVAGLPKFAEQNKSV